MLVSHPSVCCGTALRSPSPQLFYRTGRLRVVISTANLVDYDWRDIENASRFRSIFVAGNENANLLMTRQTVWVQDIPKLPSPVAADPKQENFASAMVRVLHGVNVAPALANFLSNDVRYLNHVS